MDNAVTTGGGTLPAATWMERFSGVLLAPRQTFKAILSEQTENPGAGVGGAALTVLIVFALDGLRMTPPASLQSAWLTVPLSISVGFCLWLCTAGLILILASTFGAPASKINACTVCLGWSTLPWLFMAPIFCYQHLLGPIFPVVAIVPFAWMFTLQILSIAESFALKTWQIVALFCVAPLLFAMIQLVQTAQAVYVSVSSLT